MEEDKKELVSAEARHEKNKAGHFSNCPLSGHKVIGAILLGVGIFVIFSIGVGVGSHSNNYRENNYRSFGENNFEQRGGRMMQEERLLDRNGGGCRMMENNNNQVQGGGCPMINQAENQADYLIPVKAASSTIIK